MKNIFFVDSENVGDSWIELFDYLNDEDIILVFYTDKSPNMSYKKKSGQKNVRRKIFTTHIHFILQLLFLELVTTSAMTARAVATTYVFALFSILNHTSDNEEHHQNDYGCHNDCTKIL